MKSLPLKTIEGKFLAPTRNLLRVENLSTIKFALDTRYELAIIAIVFAAVMDGLDGRIARLIKGTSKVGKELDSLTDVISFGVAPAFIMYFWALSETGRIGWLISLIYVV